VGSSATGDMHCEQCVGDKSQSIYIGASVVGAVLLVAVVFSYWRNRTGNLADKSRAVSNDLNRANELVQTAQRKKDVAWNALSKIKIPFKILMSYAQITSGFSFNFRIRFPLSFNSIMKVFSFASIDFISLAPMGCVFPTSYHNILLGYTMAPIFVSACLLALYKILSHEKYAKSDIRNTIFNLFLIFTYLILPTTSTKVLNTFNCDHLDGGDVVLASDLSIDCNSSTHKFFEAYAFAMAIVFPLGIPLLYATALYRARTYLDPGQENLVNTRIVQLIVEESDVSETQDIRGKPVSKTVCVVGYLVTKEEVEKAVAVAANACQEVAPLQFESKFRAEHPAMFKHVKEMNNVNCKFW
jgi:hypothetical protein